jgi:hypothetical protein
LGFEPCLRAKPALYPGFVLTHLCICRGLRTTTADPQAIAMACYALIGRATTTIPWRRLERETRLELATPTLARSGSNSEYERTGKRSRDAYFPAGSMLFDAELTAVEVKPRRPVGGRVRAHSCVPT